MVLTDAEHQKLAQLGELIHAAKRSKQSEQQEALQISQKQSHVTGDTDLNSQSQQYETVTAHTLNIGDVIMIEAGVKWSLMACCVMKLRQCRKVC